MSELITIECESFPKHTRVVVLEGTEALSTPYEFRVGLVLGEGNQIPLDEVVGARVSLFFDRGKDGTLPYRGVVASCELVHAWDEQCFYLVVITPRLWHLGLTRHSHVWLEQSIDQILTEVLERNGLTGDDVSLQLQETYESRDHVCQFDESDLDFIQRWMEREGIYYFFDHSGDVEKLVICDSLGVHDASVEDVPYIPSVEEDIIAHQALDSFRCRRRAIAQRVEVRDYNYRKPAVPPKGDGDAGPNALGVERHFGLNVREDGEGQRIARVRAEAQKAAESPFQGRGVVYGLRPGYRFNVVEHPLDTVNADFLAVRVRHEAKQSDASPRLMRLFGMGDMSATYMAEVEAIAADVQYRHPRTTPVPRVDGVLHGVVDGADDSDYAQLDDDGRYLVRLQLDEADSDAGRASMRVRMMQPHAGSPEGFHFPLRKGTDVLLVFLGGDPDRPVIAGAVPNPQTPSPVTKSNHTQNVMWTGGDNRIVMEDNDGEQFIHLHTPTKDTYQRMGAPNAPHNLKWHTDGMSGLFVGQSMDIEIGDEEPGNLKEHVTGNVEETYDQDHTLHVLQNREVTVDLGHTVTVHEFEDYTVDHVQTITIGASRDATVTDDETLAVGNNQWHEITGHRDVIVKQDQKLHVQGARSELVADNLHLLTAKQYASHIGSDGYIGLTQGNYDQTVHGDYTLAVTGKYTLRQQEDELKFKYKNDTSLTYGMTKSVFIGVKLDASLAAKVSVDLGASLTLALAGKFTFAHGIKFGIDKTIDLKKKAPMVIKSGTMEVTQEGTTLTITSGELVV